MKSWTQQETDFLKKYYKKLSYLEISRKLNRSTGSTYWKAFDLNLKKGRWNEENRLNKEKIIKLLIEQNNKLGKSPSLRNIPISLRSACQRHFGNLNNAKRAAGLDIKKHIKILPKSSYKPSKEFAYIIGLLLGDGSFRYQKSKERTSYVITFTTKDKDLMDIFINKFQKWSDFKLKVAIRKDGFRKFPNGKTSYYKKTYNTQISSKEAWNILKNFKENPIICLKFFPIELYKWLIKGLWDAEGCINITNNNIRISFSNSNKHILFLYEKLLREHKLRYYTESLKNGCTNIKISNGFDVLRFIKIIQGITIKRKENPEVKRIIRNLECEYKKINLNFSLKEQVYELIKQVPHGYVSSYAQIAKALKSPKAYRAIGQILKKNPDSVNIPCFKIVKNDGSIGGYFGNDMKRIKNKVKLLKKEGIQIKNNKIVNFKKVLFKFD